MTTSTPIRFDHVGKQYRRGEYTSLRDTIPALLWPGRPLGRGKNPRQELLALDDLSFEVRAGETFGIIGPNGAGKSTVLKLLAGITRPSAGRVTVTGRVASLIEVGAGFHPDLTGRENVYLNGAIIGMRRPEVRRKFDAIVGFAELRDAIDTPVKRYSSGMYMRLGFAVAAHLEPDVLLVDEVLAVGDRSFQAKCMRRMREIAGSGATVLFISHDLDAVQGLCSRGVYLQRGRAVASGPMEEVIQRYLDDIESASEHHAEAPESSGAEMDITRVICRDEDGRETVEAITGRPLTIEMAYVAHVPVQRPIFTVGIRDGDGQKLLNATMLIDGRMPEWLEGSGVMRCRFEALPLLPRSYQVWCAVRSDFCTGDIVDWKPRAAFRVVDVDPGFVDLGPEGSLWQLNTEGAVYARYRWEYNSEDMVRPLVSSSEGR